MKKSLAIVLTSAFILGMLTGCCREHQWVEASCSTPKTCVVCGKTEGDPLQHQWSTATCSTPMTCSLCDITQGQTLPHTEGTPATYQSGALCSVCGQEMSSPLQAEFDEKNITGTFIEINTPAPYKTACYDDPTLSTTGTVAVIDYRRFPSDESHEAKDGYEWITYTWEATMGDTTSNEHGYMMGPIINDFYTIKDFTDSFTVVDDLAGIASFTVNMDGTLYGDCICEWGNWDWGNGWYDKGDGTSQITGTATTYLLVPAGYDGIVSGLRNRQLDWPDGSYIYDINDPDALFFRCN